MAIEVFNRHENKYLISEATLSVLRQALDSQMELDPYNRGNTTYTITNIYYDTDDSYLIRTSLDKPRYKEKLRLRGYGVPSLDDKVYVEIKKKISGFVNKRRSGMKLADAYDFLEAGRITETKPGQNAQVLREIEYMLSQHSLKPSLYLAYDRLAYFGRDDRELRISFDCNIRSRRTDFRLEAGDHGDLLLPEGTWLMEIKTCGCMPFWLPRLLSEHKIFPTSFSKYGREYQNRVVERVSQHAPVLQMPSVRVQNDGRVASFRAQIS